MSERLIGQINWKDEEVKIYICKDDHIPDSQEYMFFRIKTPEEGMGLGLTIRRMLYLANLEPPLGG
jgi:hypothetical protein